MGISGILSHTLDILATAHGLFANFNSSLIQQPLSCKEHSQHNVLDLNSCAGYVRSIKDTEHHMDSARWDLPPLALKARLPGVGCDHGGGSADLLLSDVRKCNWVYCDLCGASFTEQKNMSRHRKKHTELASYACPVCGKILSRQDSLIRHLQICKPV